MYSYIYYIGRKNADWFATARVLKEVLLCTKKNQTKWLRWCWYAHVMLSVIHDHQTPHRTLLHWHFLWSGTLNTVTMNIMSRLHIRYKVRVFETYLQSITHRRGKPFHCLLTVVLVMTVPVSYAWETTRSIENYQEWLLYCITCHVSTEFLSSSLPQEIRLPQSWEPFI